MAKRLLATFMAAMVSSFAFAEDRTAPVKIGVLTDLTGGLATKFAEGSYLATQMAVEEFGGKVNGLPIEILVADMQQKVDLTMSIAREWIDVDGVDLIVDVPNSAAALAVAGLVKEKDKIMMTVAGTSDLTGESCTPNTLQWSYDNYSNSASLTNALVEFGAKRWFYITADYVFGHNMEELSSQILRSKGGEVAGAIRQPVGVIDQAAAVMQAAATNPDVVALASAGPDLQNSIKQLKEFGVTREGGPMVGAFALQQDDIHALGLELAQGLYIPLPFMWNMNDTTTAWSQRFMERSGGVPPHMRHATVYSTVIHFLKAMERNTVTSGKEILDTMKSFPSEDALFAEANIRVDGRRETPIILFKIKAPSESTGEWDLVEAVGLVPAEESIRPLSEGGCYLAD